MFYNKHRNNTYFRKMADFEVKLNNIGSYTGDIQSIITSLLLETKDGNVAKVKRFQKSLKYLGYKARAEKNRALNIVETIEKSSHEPRSIDELYSDIVELLGEVSRKADFDYLNVCTISSFRIMLCQTKISFLRI